MDRKFVGKIQDAVTAARLGNFEASERILKSVLRKTPSHFEALTTLGALYGQSGRFEMALPLFERARAVRPEDADCLFNIGLIHSRRGDSDLACTHYTAALKLNPRHANAASNLGGELMANKRWDEALSHYRASIERLPSHAPTFMCNLGIAQLEAGHVDEAIETLSKAVATSPNDPMACSNLGLALQRVGRLDEAVEILQRALTLAPRLASIYNNLGLAMIDMGAIADGVSNFRRAIELGDDVDFRWNHGMALLLQGDFKRGWAEYRQQETLRRPRSESKISAPYWWGEPIEGKKIIVWVEQGLGDILQFVRFLPALVERNAVVTFECHAALIPLLAPALQNIECISAAAEPDGFDFQCPLMGLPARLNIDLSSIPSAVPYLSVEQGLVDQWKERLAAPPAFKIGICWQGNKQNSADRHRSIPLSDFAPLAELPAVRLISLQKPPGTEQLDAVDFRHRIETLGDDFDTKAGAFRDTAAVMMNLDLIVSCDTSIAHLAGALGRPLIVPLPRVPDWRWLLDRSDSPWYPTARLFRQQKDGDWRSLFESIAATVRQAASLPADKAVAP